MNGETNSPIPQVTEDAEPKAELTPVPILLIGLLALLAFLGFLYLDKHGAGFDGGVYYPYSDLEARNADWIVGPPDPRVLGQKIFSVNCVACHQASGLGLPGQFPPVAGSEWVNAKSPNRIIRAVLNGLTGPIKVKDMPFSNTMVPWKATLSDQQIADVLTFVRGNKEWGNDASPVSAEDVTAIRKKIGTREQPFTPDELLKVPEDEPLPSMQVTPAAADKASAPDKVK